MPKTVMIVEDEPLLAMLVEDMLGELGLIPSTPVSLQDASERLKTMPPDFALVDLNVWGARSDDLIADLQNRGIPFAIMSGSDSSEIREQFGDVVALNKPFQMETLIHTLSSLV